MITAYLKHAFRSLSKDRSYSVLNIIGLAASLTCFVFIALWVTDELNYDKFNQKYDHIFRLTSMEKTETGTIESAVSSAPMAAALKNDYPEVEESARLRMREEIVEYKGQQILQSNILVTDPSFFYIFSYQLTKGNITTALSEPFSIILTESSAKKYFGDGDPMGQTLTLYMYDSTNRGAQYQVTGVIADPPENTHLKFSMLASFKTVEAVNPNVLTADGWGDASFYTYVLLKKGVDYRSFSKKISQFYGKYIGDMFAVWRNIYFYKLQPLSKIHLESHLQYEITPTGNINNVYIFSTIGILILFLAVINYINLATARAINRAKEVSIKKSVGAETKQLVIQYVLEALLSTLIAFSISLLFCVLLEPLFFEITSKNLSPLSSPLFLVFIAGVALLLGILSGIYPALVISAFRPVNILKGSFKTGTAGVFLRKSLVTAQFVITIVLTTGIVIIYSQMRYVRQKDLGYRKEGLITLKVNGNSDVIERYESFKNALMTSSLVSGMTTSNSLIVAGLASGVSETVDVNGNPLQVNTARLRADDNFLNVYGIRLLAGKNFNSTSTNDSVRSILLNQSAIQKFGWKHPEAIIGKPFKMGGQKGVVTGVVNDFHFNSLHEAIQPLAIYPLSPLRERFSRITVQADISRAGTSLAWVHSTWKKFFPSALFDYNFFDKQIWDQYQAEQRFTKIFSCFSLLSLLIACLGLYGLISYAASQKIKEIGIRKVLGASVKGIVVLLTKDFLKLMLLAFIVAIPIAWYAMQRWLQDFVYRVNITWWMFAVAGAAALSVAMLTVSFQAIKAAIANPVKSLRTE